MPPTVAVGLNAVIVAVTDEVPRILTVRRPGHTRAAASTLGALPALESPTEALPFGPLDPEADRTLERGLRRWVADQTGLSLGYVEQLYTFGDRDRDPRVRHGGPRVLAVAYLALVREVPPVGGGGAQWRDWYEFFPWEDWRAGRPEPIDAVIAPALDAWARATPEPALEIQRRTRSEITFGLGGAGWDEERVLERYELLYETGLVAEAARDSIERGDADSSVASGIVRAGPPAGLGHALALDHRRILASALGRLRGKLKYRPVVFELIGPTFTLLGLQQLVEALAGERLHKGNFRRLVEKGGLVEGTGKRTHTGGRPAELFRFRKEVLRERLAPGVGLPGAHPGH